VVGVGKWKNEKLEKGKERAAVGIRTIAISTVFMSVLSDLHPSSSLCFPVPPSILLQGHSSHSIHPYNTFMYYSLPFQFQNISPLQD
jgi:hypothetical protein